MRVAQLIYLLLPAFVGCSAAKTTASADPGEFEVRYSERAGQGDLDLRLYLRRDSSIFYRRDFRQVVTEWRERTTDSTWRKLLSVVDQHQIDSALKSPKIDQHDASECTIELIGRERTQSILVNLQNPDPRSKILEPLLTFLQSESFRMGAKAQKQNR